MFIFRGNIQLTYSLYVTDFTPKQASLQGGTDITIYGGGFKYTIIFLFIRLLILLLSMSLNPKYEIFQIENSPSCDLNTVTFGENECEITSCSASKINCLTSHGFSTFAIDNSGVHPCSHLFYFLNETTHEYWFCFWSWHNIDTFIRNHLRLRLWLHVERDTFDNRIGRYRQMVVELAIDH